MSPMKHEMKYKPVDVGEFMLYDHGLVPEPRKNPSPSVNWHLKCLSNINDIINFWQPLSAQIPNSN